MCSFWIILTAAVFYEQCDPISAVLSSIPFLPLITSMSF